MAKGRWGEPFLPFFWTVFLLLLLLENVGRARKDNCSNGHIGLLPRLETAGFDFGHVFYLCKSNACTVKGTSWMKWDGNSTSNGYCAPLLNTVFISHTMLGQSAMLASKRQWYLSELSVSEFTCQGWELEAVQGQHAAQ